MAASSSATALLAPRNLKLPVRCIDSIFRRTVTPASRESSPPSSSGVRRTMDWMRAAAAWTSFSEMSRIQAR